jgi:DNA-binding MarR family transcriptional regulator
MIDRKKYIEELIDGVQLLKRKSSRLSYLKDASITGSQWMVIGQIFRNEGCTTNDVADALNMTGSAVTQLVGGLVAKGYVTREPSSTDRRSQKLILSQQSKKHIAVFKKERIHMILKMFEVLSDLEFTKYVALNKKILDAMRAK